MSKWERLSSEGCGESNNHFGRLCTLIRYHKVWRVKKQLKSPPHTSYQPSTSLPCTYLLVYLLLTDLHMDSRPSTYQLHTDLPTYLLTYMPPKLFGAEQSIHYHGVVPRDGWANNKVQSSSGRLAAALVRHDTATAAHSRRSWSVHATRSGAWIMKWPGSCRNVTLLFGSGIMIIINLFIVEAH